MKLKEKKKNAKPYRNLGICSDTISQNQELKNYIFINSPEMITQTIYILICTGVNAKQQTTRNNNLSHVQLQD